MYEDGKLLSLAREVAMEIIDIDTVLASHGLNTAQFDAIKQLPRFQNYLEHEILSWGTSLNASERVKIKSITLMEEWLPELNAQMHAPTNTLAARVEAGKLVARLAGLGINLATAGSGENFSVTINMGADRQVKIEKQIRTVPGTDEYGTAIDEFGYSQSNAELG